MAYFNGKKVDLNVILPKHRGYPATVKNRASVTLENVSPIQHLISAKLTVESENLIDNDEFFASVDSFGLSGNLGHEYTISYVLKEGADLTDVEFQFLKYYEIEGGTNMENHALIYDGTINFYSHVFSIEDGCTYELQIIGATFSDVFEEVAMYDNATYIDDISNVNLGVYTESNELITEYKPNANGIVEDILSFSPTMILATSNQVIIEATYEKDIDCYILEVEAVLDTIIEEQERIIERQNVLIGGGNV